MKYLILSCLLLLGACDVFGWGFFAHRRINTYAVFLLPPELLAFYKPHLDYITQHAVDPDKRRYLLPEEGARHYIDIDHYGEYPYDSLPRKWQEAQERFSPDTMQRYGIVPWWIQIMLSRLTRAFEEKNAGRILKLSAELGHYIGDAHVPLHASSNHNGQLTGQTGIHGFWESRIPELLADKDWNFLLGKAQYIPDPLSFTWQRVLESAAAADTVLRVEKILSMEVQADQRFSFEERNGKVIRQYASSYALAYDRQLKGMVERRMQAAVFAIASFWYTAWVNAGQPDLSGLTRNKPDPEEEKEWEELNRAWVNGGAKEDGH